MRTNPANQPETQQIACQQVLQEDNSVFSIQWTDLPPGMGEGVTPAFILERYLAAIASLTCGIVRPMVDDDGISFCLVRNVPLLRFLPATPVTDGAATGLALRICGGLLVQPQQCERGELLFLTERLTDGMLRITLRLADYCPLLLGSGQPSWLRRRLYRMTQASLHRLVTIRFLARLYRELDGKAVSVRTIKAHVRNGRQT